MALKAAGRLKKIDAHEFSGWADFVKIVDGYAEGLLEHKKGFNVAMASEEQISMMKLYDRDVWLINNFIKKIPSLFVKNINDVIKKRQEEEQQEAEQLRSGAI